MSKINQWQQTEINITKNEDGSLILQNKIPLAECPDNICCWLHKNAESVPNKKYFQERDAEGIWKGLTHAEALAQVNRISNRLISMEMDTTRPVAILSENCINFALTQMAVMQIGLAVTPISFAYSAGSQTGGHIKHILDVSKASALIMSDADLHMPKFNQWDLGDLQLFAFSNSQKHSGVQDFENLFAVETELSAEAQLRFKAVNPETLAKVQFTSGSTNLPKGVKVTHSMMTSNQVGIGQMWPFLTEDEVIIDWLPWNHTFGGNFVFNMMLMCGGSFYIDNGNPTPLGLQKTIENIKDISPTIYFSVPRGYTSLYAKMQEDEELKQAFFKNLKFIFTAAAALDQATFSGLKAMSREVLGEEIPFFAGWGTTETAPDATLVYWPMEDARVIGLPIPGVEIKMTPDPSGKTELRVKGACITNGYFNNPEATTKAFDETGYYKTQDGGKFLDQQNPEAGLLFDGRTSEDFKLNTGTWVFNSGLRNSINALGQPSMLEVVVAAPNKAFLAAMVFPNIPILRKQFEQASTANTDNNDFLQCSEVIEFFRHVFQQHNSTHKGSSTRFERFTLLREPPRIDKNETTDKGYINQMAVLSQRAEIVESLYAETLAQEVFLVENL
ncbi:MAG: AMP-binding protein [SAR324 cluster bacterium]|nr:AMP-binding protein [SAR324 cluster bacterium]